MKWPEDMKSTEELYLAATHLEQYRHATFSAGGTIIWKGSGGNPTDIRLNNGYGLLQLRRGNLESSIRHFKKLSKKQTWKNPNPYHGECWFNLGLALEESGKYGEAFDAFYKSTWSYETQASGFYHLACLSARKGELHKSAGICGKLPYTELACYENQDIEGSPPAQTGKGWGSVFWRKAGK